jgi:hypothetical protein
MDHTENDHSIVEISFTEPLHSNGHGTDPQETSYVLAVTCLSVRYLAIHVTLSTYHTIRYHSPGDRIKHQALVGPNSLCIKHVHT